MNWTKLSLDEIEHNQELINEFKKKPAKTAIELVKVCLCDCLSKLGVQNPWSEIARIPEMEMLGIDIMECDERSGAVIAKAAHKNYVPEILGYYIYQWDIPRFFIPRPEPPKDGEAVFRIYDLQKEVESKVYRLRLKWTI